MSSHDQSRLTRVGVYSTLKKGGSNRHVLTGCRFVGQCQLPQVTLYDTGPYPGAKLRHSEGVDVEIYDVPAEVFARLDELEDYNPQCPGSGEYGRRQLDTTCGPAWIYLYNPDVSGLSEIRRGGWIRKAIRSG